MFSETSRHSKSEFVAVEKVFGRFEGMGSTRRQLFTSPQTEKGYHHLCCYPRNESSSESSYAPPRDSDMNSTHETAEASSDDSFRSAEVFVTDREVQENSSDVISTQKGTQGYRSATRSFSAILLPRTTGSRCLQIRRSFYQTMCPSVKTLGGMIWA